MEEVHTDHGRGDFGGGFTEMLESFGIKHEGSLPNRSQAQGSVESSNRLLQNQLNRICAENVINNGINLYQKSFKLLIVFILIKRHSRENNCCILSFIIARSGGQSI